MKPRVGVSACLLGEKVRYDGDHRLERFVLEDLGRLFDLVPVCPEVEAGFGVPRETVQLEGDDLDRLRMVTTRTRLDQTSPMLQWAGARVEQLARERLCGFILKKGSPSCGVAGVKVYSGTDPEPRMIGQGLFARALRRRFPGLPLADEEMLRDPAFAAEFVARVRSFTPPAS
jgi:uncharacterized protein YbbK (DUF523 family)